jgi:hypothetical protein
VEDTELIWRKAAASASNGGGCVEIADHADNVFVRDTTARQRGMLTVDREAFGALLASVKRGEMGMRLPGHKEARHQRTDAGLRSEALETLLVPPCQPCGLGAVGQLGKLCEHPPWEGGTVLGHTLATVFDRTPQSSITLSHVTLHVCKMLGKMNPLRQWSHGRT